MLTMRRLKKCFECDSVAVSLDGLCLDHLQVQPCIHRPEYPMPDGKRNPFGVEVEYYLPRPRTDTYKIMGHTTGDGSLGNNGHESKFCEESSEIGRIVAERCKALTLSGGYVDNSCGLHVHMSCILKNEKESVVSETFRKHEDYLFSTLFPHRRTNWCNKLYGWRLNGWLYNKYRTVECRLHEGTLNGHAIMAWVQVCQKIQSVIKDINEDRDSKLRETAYTKHFTELFKPNSSAYKYLKHREMHKKADNFRVKSFERA